MLRRHALVRMTDNNHSTRKTEKDTKMTTQILCKICDGHRDLDQDGICELCRADIKGVAAEISAMLSAKGLAGAIAVAGPLGGAFKITFPAWAGVRPVGGGAGLAMKLSDERPEHADASVHLMLGLRDQALYMSNVLQDWADTLTRVLEENDYDHQHKPFGGDPPPMPNMRNVQ